VIETCLVLTVALLALLVGAAIPVLVQLRQTMKTAQLFLESTGKRLDRVLDEASEATGRINRIGTEIERGAQHLKAFIDLTADLGRLAGKLRDTVQTMAAVASALGPSFAAAAHAFWSPRPDGETRGTEEDGGSESGATRTPRPTDLDSGKEDLPT